MADILLLLQISRVHDRVNANGFYKSLCSLGLVGAGLHRAGRSTFIVTAVHFLVQRGLVVEPLTGVVGDLQEAARLHYDVRLARIRHDGVLRNHLQGREREREKE